MAKTTISSKIANVFGSFGYFSVIIQWLLFVAIIVFPLLEASGTKHFFMPDSSTESNTLHLAVILPAGVQVAFGVVAVVFCLLVAIYAIYAIPRSIGKTGRKLTQASATTVINHIPSGAPLTAEQKAHITLSITWTVKIILIIAPFALLFLPLDSSIELTRAMVTTLGMICASFSIFWFGVQYIIATLAHISPKNIW